MSDGGVRGGGGGEEGLTGRQQRGRGVDRR